MAFDNSDPYQVHAYFLLGFWCRRCGVELNVNTKEELPSDQWCFAVAEEVRAAGWYVSPPEPNGDMDIETCFCPACLRGQMGGYRALLLKDHGHGLGTRT